MARSANTPPAWRSRCAKDPLGIRSGWGMGCSEFGFRYWLWAMVAVNDAEHHRNEEQCRDRGEYQTADHGAAQRRILFAGAPPMHMIAPVSAGTDSVVWVANSIHTMPAMAAGSAVMMTKGSVHDWKFTTIS